MVLTVLRILDTAITLTFYTIIAVAAVLVFGAFFWIIDTINRFHHWLRGKRYKSMFVAPPRRRKRRWRLVQLLQFLFPEKKRRGRLRASPRGADRIAARKPIKDSGVAPRQLRGHRIHQPIRTFYWPRSKEQMSVTCAESV
jgi:hypothetical protein